MGNDDPSILDNYHLVVAMRIPNKNDGWKWQQKVTQQYMGI